MNFFPASNTVMGPSDNINFTGQNNLPPAIDVSFNTSDLTATISGSITNSGSVGQP